MKRGSIFETDGIPRMSEALPLAMQHVVAMIVGCVTPAIIVSGAVPGGLSREDQVILIQSALVIAALSTLLQLFPIGGKAKFAIGSGLPIIMGVSFAYVPSMQAIAESYGIAAIMGAEIVGGIAVGNPCLCHGLCAEHINQHMSGIFEIFISFRRRKFTNNDDATVIDRSDKIVCACRKDIFDRCQGMFILRLSGCNEEDCPACSGGNVQFACTVKSLYFCIVSQKQFLHKRVFVIFFGKTFQDALNLADSQFTNR